MNIETLKQIIADDEYGLLNKPNPTLYEAMKEWFEIELDKYTNQKVDNGYFIITRALRQLEYLNDILGGY